MSERTIKVSDKIPRIPIDLLLGVNSIPDKLVCLSDWDVSIIRLSLFPFFYWPTRIGRWIDGTRFELSTLSEYQDTQEKLQDLDGRLGENMACDINDGLGAIASSIDGLSASIAGMSSGSNVQTVTNNLCCEQTIINQSGGVIGNITQPVGENTYPFFGTEEPLEVSPGEFPEGFETEEEYLLDKCQVSNLMVTGVIQSLRNLASLGVFNGVALAGLVILAISGAIVFPPAAIPLMCAAIGILSVNVTILAVVAQEIEDNREEWVCAVYNSDSAEIAVSLIADLIDGIVASIGATGPVAMAIKQVVMVLVNADTLNQAYSKVAHLLYPDADCSGCIVDCGDEGTPQHFPVYSNAGDGAFSFTSNVFRIEGTVDGGDGVGYRYSGYFGGVWPTPPFPARKAISVNCSSNLDGTAYYQGTGGYFQLRGPDLSFPPGAPAFRSGTTGYGYVDIGAINAFLAENEVCVSIINTSDGHTANWLEVTFDS